MAYVRQHGNQLAIVSGERDKETGSVQQRVLFTFYSKDEAKAAIGTGTENRKSLFQNLMCKAYPGSKFDWEKINQAIEQKLDILPEKYESRTAECSKDLSSTIKALVKDIVLADPYLIPSARAVLKSQKRSLLALRELIDNCLSRVEFYKTEKSDSEAEQKDSFHWRYLLRGSEVPPDIEEWAENFYRSQKYPMAEAVFELLVGAFDNYAEGYNYLGLIALEQRQYKKAVGYFEKTVAVGRNLFPRNLPKEDYWLNHSTRPYIRGLTNLILSLTANGDYEAALNACDKMQKECGDKATTNELRGTIYLNLSEWAKAVASTSEDDFVKAFALFEMGNQQKALECFLQEAVKSPHTARMLLDMKKPVPKDGLAVDDHNAGVYLVGQLSGYFKIQSEECQRFFNDLSKQPTFIDMLKQIDQHRYNHSNGPREKHRQNFDEWHTMEKKPYIKDKAKELMRELSRDSVKAVK